MVVPSKPAAITADAPLRSFRAFRAPRRPQIAQVRRAARSPSPLSSSGALQAIALKPDYTAAYNNLGVLLQSLGEQREALHFWSEGYTKGIQTRDSTKFVMACASAASP